MKSEWRQRAPSAHCYDCGSMNIVAVCHHCGRTMCAEHGVSTEVSHGSTEFTGLNLDHVTAWHCLEHDHTVNGGLRWLVGAGAGATAIGIVCLLLSAFWTGGSFVVVGGAAMAAGIVVSRRRRALADHARPPFPLIPTIESVGLNEKIHATIRFDEDTGYTITPLPPIGRLIADMTVRKADRKRLITYQEKYGLNPRDPLPFSAGFVVLRGPVGLQFDDPRYTVPVFPLSGMVHELPFLLSDDVRNGRRYQKDLTYRPWRRVDADSIPLWLTPSIVAESDRRTLALDIQWDREFGHQDQVLEIDHINEIRLITPVGWGAIRSIELDRGVRTNRRSFGRANDPDDPDESVYLIKLAGVRLPASVKDSCRLRVLVEYEGRIETTDSIRGSLNMRFRNALSGVSEVQVYHALGGLRRWARIGTAPGARGSGVTTTVTADFVLSLAKVRYQDALVLPGKPLHKNELRVAPAQPQTAPVELTAAPVELTGVVPDHRTVAALTDALSHNKCYVKRVVENPGSNGPRADEVRRYWDITGRFYYRLFPVEFRITMTGYEVRSHGGKAIDASTTVAVTVRGVYTDTKMKDMIEQTWKRLREQTVEALKNPGSDDAVVA